MFTLKKEG